MNFWDIVERTKNIIGVPSGYRAVGISRVLEEKNLDEGTADLIQHAAMAWLSDQFHDMDAAEVQDQIANRSDELYVSWVQFADKYHGIGSVAGQQTGWEMIVGGLPWTGNAPLSELPGKNYAFFR